MGRCQYTRKRRWESSSGNARTNEILKITNLTTKVNEGLVLEDVLNDSRWDMTYLGMQVLIEGLALAADHVGDVVADRADHGAAPAQGTAVVDQGLPVGQFLIGERFGESQCAAELAPEGVFLFPHLAQRGDLVDRRILRLARLGEKQAGLGAQTTVDATAEKGRGRCVDLCFQNVVGTFERWAAHDCIPL